MPNAEQAESGHGRKQNITDLKRQQQNGVYMKDVIEVF